MTRSSAPVWAGSYSGPRCAVSRSQVLDRRGERGGPHMETGGNYMSGYLDGLMDGLDSAPFTRSHGKA